ncbi:MAG: hypothetical protein WCS65_12605 [Verrucomicrobiae bacterium]
MTLDELEASADAIAARRADPRTSELVRRAFLTPGALTLRKYLALEEEGSPLLSGNWPWEDPEAMAHAFCTAYAILFPEREIPPANLVGAAIAEMVAEVTRGFSTVMPMKFPRPPGAAPAHEYPDGIGWIARLVARLIATGFRDPLDMPLDRLFILSAAMAANEGAECAGEDYRDRSAGGNPHRDPDPKEGGAKNDQETKDQ